MNLDQSERAARAERRLPGFGSTHWLFGGSNTKAIRAKAGDGLRGPESQNEPDLIHRRFSKPPRANI